MGDANGLARSLAAHAGASILAGRHIMSERRRVLILGAGGRDFHVFNTLFRDDPTQEVVAFTAAQIPHIDNRAYPAELAGALYPDGLPILSEDDLEDVIAERKVEHAVFAYSDVSLAYLDRMRERVEACGVTFAPFDADATLLQSSKPCVAVCGVRTGCGKSGLSRYVVSVLRELGLTVSVVRHPMPYGKLRDQIVQRFATLDDLVLHDCTIEEREEYEPHIVNGNVVFAGADYARILAQAEEEADIVLWDGGNNDTPFYRPDLLITVLDPLRPGDETRYFPSLWNLERAHVLVIGKTGQASEAGIAEVRANIARHNPRARVIDGRSRVELTDASAVAGKRVLVVEDGPTVTHGGMGYGAGLIAARQGGAAEIVDPRPAAVGEIKDAFQKYPHLRNVLPALGYGAQQVQDLQATIEATDCDVVVVGTPIDLAGIVNVSVPMVRARYGFEETGGPGVSGFIRQRFER